jgi:hypothetical protein
MLSIETEWALHRLEVVYMKPSFSVFLLLTIGPRAADLSKKENARI